MSHVIAIVLVSITAFGTVHALLNKQDPRAALGWIILCIAVPLFGPLAYLLLGVNRSSAVQRITELQASIHEPPAEITVLDNALDRVTARLSRYPCTRNNRVQLLQNGEQAYPAMLEAIDNASRSVLLCTYIFDSDDMGQKFVAALEACVSRGVEVRVLIDSVGSLYSFPSAIRSLRKRGVRTSRFLPLFHRYSWQFNMRNHRKMLIVDGSVAFTGGMNIGNRHMVGRHTAGVAEDTQFRIEGEAVRSLLEIFGRDWEFATRESLSMDVFEFDQIGQTACRPISDGPGPDLGTLPKLLLGLIGCAAKNVTIVTPYFLPPPAIVGALIGAALRGVRVRVLIPARTNLPYVTWATEHALEPITNSSIEVSLQPAPFSHTKMLLIDDDFVQIGSYNMDTRSLRLNFELAVNIFDRELRQEIDAELEQRFARSKRVDHSHRNTRSLPARIRNAAFWLFTPYL